MRAITFAALLASTGLAWPALAETATAAPDAAPPEGDEVIADPELAHVPPAPAVRLFEGGSARLELASRLSMFAFTHAPGQDLWNWLNWGSLEVEYRRSPTLRFATGARVDVRAAAPRTEDGGFAAARTELYVLPTAAYVDATPASGLHVRLGYQKLAFGRFDLFSQADVLARYDLSRGVTTDPAALRLPDLAARMDWDVRSWLTLSVAYVPLFEGHRFAGYGSNAALLPVVGGPHSSAAFAAIGTYVARSFQPSSTADLARALGPERSLAEPQVVSRLTARGRHEEVSFTAGTALEHLPIVKVSDNFAGYLENPAPATLNPPTADLLRGQAPFQVTYPRYVVLALDGSVAAGPLHLKAEVAYTPQRTLYAATANGAEVIQPERTRLVHARVGAEYIDGENLTLLAEALVASSLDGPVAKGRSWWGYPLEGRALPAAFFASQWRPGGGAIRLELGAFALPGPSLFATPRVEWRARGGLFFDGGLFIVTGPRPASPWQANVAFGGLFDRLSQAFVGVRWLP